MYRNIVYEINRTTWQGMISLLTWDENGNPITETYQHDSTLYYDDPRGSYQSIYGTNLAKKSFPHSGTRRRFIDNNQSLNFYAVNKPIREFLIEKFLDDHEKPDFNRFPLRIHFFDIEIAVENEFPSPEKADYPINLITIYDTALNQYFTWALGKCNFTRENATIISCKTEKELFLRFLDWFSCNYPDILSGWNSDVFDLPYIINRMEKIVPEEVHRLSPFGRYFASTRINKKRLITTYTLIGITHLDYLFLYRDKFLSERRFSYKLGNVACDELGIGKKEFDGKFRDFYKFHFDEFVEYNIRDVELLVWLDAKLKLIHLARTICTMGLCEFDAIYSSVPYIYGAICADELRNEGRLYPYKTKDEEKEEEYEGAFVFEPRVGLYTNGIASVDFNSLYPSTMITLNISPETKFAKIISTDENGKHTLQLANRREKVITQSQLDFLLEKHCTLSSNKVLYVKPHLKKGSIPRFLEKLYAKRKDVKYKKHLLDEQISAMKSHEDHDKNELSRCMNDSEMYAIMDKAYKAFLNSIYGMMGCQHTAIFDVDNAEAITLTGQFLIKESSALIDQYFIDRYSYTKGASVYGDTDSAYFTIEPVIFELFGSMVDVNALDENDIRKICYEVDSFVESLNDQCIKGVVKKQLHSDMTNIGFKREAIALQGLFLAKKRYVMHVVNDEGTKVDKFKYVGVEVKKTEIPEFVRGILKDIIESTMTGHMDNAKLNKRLKDDWDDFKNRSHGEVAFHKGLNTPKEVTGFLELEKGALAHTRAGTYYNQLIELFSLQSKYEKILVGDRIRFLTVKPNPYRIDVIAFPENFPEEFKQYFAIDYRTMFQKMIFSPVSSIMSKCGYAVVNPSGDYDFDITSL